MTTVVDVGLRALPNSGAYAESLRGLSLTSYVHLRGFDEIEAALSIGSDFAEIDGKNDRPAHAACIAAMLASKSDPFLARALGALAAQMLLAHASEPN